MNKEMLHVLRHSLGLDSSKLERRNHYLCDTGDATVDSLVSLGYMVDKGAIEWCGGMHLYCVTDAGKGIARGAK